MGFRIHLAMADNPPVSIELNIQDPASARDSMLKLTWDFVAFRRQARIESKGKIGDNFGGQNPSGSTAAPSTGAAPPAVSSPLGRYNAASTSPDFFVLGNDEIGFVWLYDSRLIFPMSQGQS
jgi:hypothetical protein